MSACPSSAPLEVPSAQWATVIFFGTKQRSLNLAQIYNLLHNVKTSFDILYADYWEHVYGHWAMFGLKMIV